MSKAPSSSSSSSSSVLLLVLFLFLSLSIANDDENPKAADDAAVDDGFSSCNCDDDGYFLSIQAILNCQRVSDFMIALAYFSIPIELLYFLTCSTFPFKWVIVEFIAFIVLCGMTHFLNGWTYGPHPFQLMLALTVFKFLTALVSFATAITLISLLPMLLSVKVREFMLKKKTTDLKCEVASIMKQTEAGLHVRMLTQEIRKSIDRHTILDTTLVELSKTLGLQSCSIWMPNLGRTEMNLVHDLKGRTFSNNFNSSIPYGDPEVLDIKKTSGAKILDHKSALVVASGSGPIAPGTTAAIRMPMLRVSNFKGGTPEMVSACYAILVLVLPGAGYRSWGEEELEIVEAVAYQVAVAISHAAVLEESQNMRDQLEEQNRALEQSRQDALMASQARVAFEMAMSNGLRRPLHTILGLLSVLQNENLKNEQGLLVDTMVKTSNVLSTLITDVMGTSEKDKSRFGIEMRYFPLHSLIKEALCLSKCLCSYRGYEFVVEVEKSLPNHVMGDERRVFQVVFHMVRHLLDRTRGRGCLTLRVYSARGSQSGCSEQRWGRWRLNSTEGYVHAMFEVGIHHWGGAQSEEGVLFPDSAYGGHGYYGALQESLSFPACKKLVQLMQGDIWVMPNSEGFDQSMALILRFHVRPPPVISNHTTEQQNDEPSADHSLHSNSLLRGIKVILADGNDVNRAVTKKLLDKLGCIVSTVSSGYDCLSAVGPGASSCRILLLDLHLPDLDGYEVAKRIRNFRRRGWPLIVALTTNDDGDMMERCMGVGMNGIIQKPSTLGEISDELNRILLQRGYKRKEKL